MPTFPPPPLSFRTAGFPQFGWKVSLSGSAFPHVAQVKPAPGMPCTSRRFASTLRALRCPTLRPALCRNSGLGGALPFEESTPLPQRSSLRSGFYCPSPSTLNRPHPSHSQAHPDFAALRFIRDALAVLVRLGDPQVVPCSVLFTERSFSACRPLHWFAFATACQVARLPGGSDRGFPQPTETFTSELSTGSVALPGGRI
jgi:hypothetical protein